MKERVIKEKYLIFKRNIDVILSIVLLITFFPVIITLLIFAYVFQGFPIFFIQPRVGRCGKKICIYKIRTFENIFSVEGANFNTEKKITYFGRVIRRFKLDEIPQLLNVLAGDMSIVGPRPLLQVDQPKNNTIRLLVRPGLTGFAQVNGGIMLTPEEKNALDCWYIYNASFSLDFCIIVKTVLVLFVGFKRNDEVIIKTLKWAEENNINLANHNNIS